MRLLPERPETALRWAGLLVALGLLVETATLFSATPLSFLTFLIVGAGSIVVGASLAVVALLRS